MQEGYWAIPRGSSVGARISLAVKLVSSVNQGTEAMPQSENEEGGFRRQEKELSLSLRLNLWHPKPRFPNLVADQNTWRGF